MSSVLDGDSGVISESGVFSDVGVASGLVLSVFDVLFGSLFVSSIKVSLFVLFC